MSKNKELPLGWQCILFARNVKNNGRNGKIDQEIDLLSYKGNLLTLYACSHE